MSARVRRRFADRDLMALKVVLARSQALGFIGPGEIEPHIRRALDMSGVLSAEPRRALDLGSGGGLPGLPLAFLYPSTAWTLLDGSVKRAAFLSEAVHELGLSDRLSVRGERAEEAGQGELRATFDLVVARSFGPPSATAECAAPFLAVGGALVVAEPPGSTGERWATSGLEKLGLGPATITTNPTAVAVMIQDCLCPDTYPRRTGVPAKRPLF